MKLSQPLAIFSQHLFRVFPNGNSSSHMHIQTPYDSKLRNLDALINNGKKFDRDSAINGILNVRIEEEIIIQERGFILTLLFPFPAAAPFCLGI